MIPVTVEHIILGSILAAETAIVAVIGFVILRRMKADSERTFRILGALIVQESEKVQALPRE